MEYSEIDRILLRHNLAYEPAFTDVNISIESIPRFNSCPLGLYFPIAEYVPEFGRAIPPGTIIVPPTAPEATVLHELGHRYGHYHYNDLSEPFAESFRGQYQKGRVLLAFDSDLSRLPSFGKLFTEGERGAVEIGLNRALSPDEQYSVTSRLHSYAGAEPRPRVAYSYGDVPIIRVEFTQGVNWPVIVGAVMAGSVVVTIGTIGYAVYKISRDDPWVVPVTLFGTGMLLLLRAMYKEASKKAVAGR